MSVLANVTQQNGTFTNQTTVTDFTPVSGDYQYQVNQICKISYTDSTNTKNDVTDVPVVATDNMPSIQFYNHNTGVWEFKNVTDLSNYNIVLKRNGNENAYIFYMAKDEELAFIPNFNNELRIRYRLQSSISASNLSIWKRIVFMNNGTTGCVPIIPFGILGMNMGGKRVFQFLATYVNDNGTLNLTSHYLPINEATNTYGADSLRFPSYSAFIESPHSEITDLDTRVGILESEMNKLKVKVQEHDKVIKDLPALVAAVSSDVSKLYVAR